MMKTLLRLMILVALSSLLFFSCATGADETTEDESLPVVSEAITEPVPEASVQTAMTAPAEAEIKPEEPVSSAELPEAETALSETAPYDETPLLSAETETRASEEELSLPEDQILPEETVKIADSAESDTDNEQDGFTEFPDFIENEFIPFEDEIAYTIDVTGYYDGFFISEDDFVAIIQEPVTEESDVPEEEPEAMVAEIPSEPVVAEEPVITSVEPELVMEPLVIPPPREDMKKPVALVTEDEAAEVSSLDKEIALMELENILSGIPEPEETPPPVPSRTITAGKNDIIEVPYLGNWWVYLGDVNGTNAVTFTGRNYISDKTVFTFRALHEGDSLLHFFKQDIIGDVMVDDYLAVSVEDTGASSDKIILETFVISQIKPVPPEPEADVGSTEDENASSDARYVQLYDEPAVMGGPLSSAGEMERSFIDERSSAAGSSWKADKPSAQTPRIAEETEVISARDDEVLPSVPAVKKTAGTLTDEEMFTQAQLLEATDIEGALSLYKKLVSTYPQSKYWNEANKRITYINRFYFFKR